MVYVSVNVCLWQVHNKLINEKHIACQINFYYLQIKKRHTFVVVYLHACVCEHANAKT